MSASIERRLSGALILSIVAAALSAALVNFFFAYREAKEFQDETLRQVAFLVSRSQWKAQASLSPDEDLDAGPFQLIVVHAPAGQLPDWVPKDLSPGFHTVAAGPDSMRVFIRDNPSGERILIAQPTDLRDDIAFDSALPTLVPVLLMLPLLLLLTVYIVRSELARVRNLAESVDRASPERLEPLPGSDVPTEIGLFVAAINRLITRINRLMDEQRRFIADAAHELRSPLTALALQAKNVEKADSLPAVRERMTSLKSGIHRAHRLAEQLLSLAKTQTQGQPDTVDVSRLVRELIEEYQPLAQKRGIDLGLDERSPVELIATAGTLRLILKNALDNALSYTRPGGDVTVRLDAEGPDAIIEVIDSGPGIPADERDRVFAPFYRVPGSPGDGSGLGLAIAHDAASRLGGSIGLHDRDAGAGLIFRYRQGRPPSRV